MARPRTLGGRRGRRPAARRARRARAAGRARPRSPSRSRTRWATWSAATPAPTVRSSPPRWPSASASGVAVCQQTLARLACAGPGARGRVPPVGCRRRVVRRRGAALAAPPLARPAAPRGRAGRAGGAGPVPAGVAERRLLRWSRPAGARRGGHAWSSSSPVAPCPPRRWSRWCCPSRVRDYQPAMLDELTATGEVLWAGHGGLPGLRRLGLAAPRRHRTPDAARPRRARALRGPRGRARRARGWRRLLLPPARLDRRARPTTRPCPPRCGTSPGTAASATTPSRRCGRSPAAAAAPTGSSAPRPGCAQRAPAAVHARRCAPAPPDVAGPLVPAPRARARPDQARPRGRREPARAPRRRHPRRGDERTHAGRLRRRLQGALRLRGDRPLPTRLLRRGTRRRPVRHGRRGRPAAHPPARQRPSREADRPRPGGDRPGQPVRRRAPLAAAGVGPPARAQGRRDRRARRRRARASTSSAAARRCSPSPTTRTCSPPASRRSGASYARERSAASSSRRPTASASSARTPRCSAARWSPPASSPPPED